MLTSYVKIAWKVLCRRKFFAFISLFAISFTLVVLMVAAAALDNIFAPMAPEVNQSRSLYLLNVRLSGKEDIRSSNPGYRILNRYMRGLTTAERTSIFSEPREVAAYKDGYDVKPYLRRTDGEYWKILSFTFLEGGPFTSDDEANADFVAVINEATRERFFGGGSAVGRTIEAGRQRFRVVGVVANVPIYRQIPFADIWVPIATSPDPDYKTAEMGDYSGMILARDAADLPRIRDEFATRLKGYEFPSSQFTEIECVPRTSFDDLGKEIFANKDGHEGEMLLGVLILAAVLFMLLPTVNLVNLNISRISERASEIGVRKSFGASSRALVGQFLVENLLLTAAGGVIGFIVSVAILRMLTGSGLIQYGDFHLNIRIFLYAFCSIIAFGLISGIYPAWRMSRMHPVNALKGAVR